jgi:tetratricopeptide (TPR) repeat protein
VDPIVERAMQSNQGLVWRSPCCLSEPNRAFQTACRQLAILAFAIAALMIQQSRACAQAPAAKPVSLDPLYQAVGAEDYTKAKTLADGLAQTAAPEERIKISLLYGRVLLGLKLKEPARQYLQLMQKQDLDSTGQALLEVYTAWLTAIGDKRDDAITDLEETLAKGAKSASTLEAAEVLSTLYLERGDREDAKRAVEFGLALAKYLSVQGIRTDYLEALLRRKMQASDPSAEAERLYQAAEALRGQEKFTEAGKLFAQIIQQHGRSEWADPARFRIGQCFVGINQPDQAIEHWKKFIAERPEGPWRGQAFVGLVDVALEKKANLALAAEQAQAGVDRLASVVVSLDSTELVAGRETKPHAEHEDYTKKSWDEATYDIYVRQGIVSLLDLHGEQAAQAFEKAKQSLPKDAPETVTGGLARLIAAAEKQSPLLPSELSSGDAATVLSLSVANLYSTLHDFITAERFYTAPFVGQGKSSSIPHHAFAAFGMARAKASIYRPTETPRARLESAKALLEKSLKEYPRGSWHDETLYRFAMITQDLAETKYGDQEKMGRDDHKAATVGRGDRREPSADTVKDAKPKKPLTPQQQEELKAKAEKERIAALLKAKREAIFCWQRILDHYPKSPRVEHALYYIGLLRYEAAVAAPLSDAKKKWQEASSTFAKLCDTYPKSTHAGDAYVRQIDIALEQTFDFKQAISLADRAVEWAKTQKVEVTTNPDGRPTADAFAAAAMYINGVAASLPAWGDTGEQRSDAVLDDLYNLYLRAGMIAYLQDNYKQAAEYLKAAGPARPEDGMGDFNVQKFGVHILATSCKNEEASWYPEAIKEAKTDTQKLALKLADTYLRVQRPEKSQRIYEQLLAGVTSGGRSNRAVEGYCFMQLASAYAKQKVDRDKSIAYYKQFYKREYAELPWAPIAIMRLAVLEHNTTQDPRRSIPHYQHVLTTYPNHLSAERALYFLALDAVQLGDKGLAESSCNAFIQKYPKSGWRGHVQTVLNEEIPQLSLKAKGQ